MCPILFFFPRLSYIYFRLLDIVPGHLFRCFLFLLQFAVICIDMFLNCPFFFSVQYIVKSIQIFISEIVLFISVFPSQPLYCPFFLLIIVTVSCFLACLIIFNCIRTLYWYNVEILDFIIFLWRRFHFILAGG